jgi:signal transduction histidine kinase
VPSIALRMLDKGHLWCFLFAFGALSCAPGFCQDTTTTRHRAVLILVIDQPSGPFSRDLLEGIQDATKDAIGLTIFVDFNGPTALQTEEVVAQRQRLRMTRYAGQPIEIIVAIGDRVLTDAEKLRSDLFPSAKLLFVVASPKLIPSEVHQGEGLELNVSPAPSLRLALSLLPKTSKLVVLSGTTNTDQFVRQSLVDSLGTLMANREVTLLSGLSLQELREQVARLPESSLIVLTSNMVDRSGRATNNIDQAHELSQAAKVPLIEGSDLSLGQGSLGGDVVSLHLAGQELGKRIRRTLDTGQAPVGVLVDPAPRRRALDWRQLKRFAIPEGRVPRGFEILYRQPTLWEQHRGIILTVTGGLVLQSLLISFLLAERRRRARAQARMRRHLDLEAMVSKASADLSAATHEQLPATLRELSAGLAACLGIERVSVWMFEPERHEYTRVHFWPDTEAPWKITTTFAQTFPYIHDELVAARNVIFTRLEELPLNAAQDVLELRKTGMVSFLGIPLKLAERPIGAFFIATFTHPIHWESEVISTLQVLSEILAQDISRSIAEERVRRTEEQSRAMLASLPGFVLMIDGKGQILKQTIRLELPETELPQALADASVGKDFLELWAAGGEGASQVAEALRNVALGRKTSLIMEYQYQGIQGVRWMEVRAETLYGEESGAVVSHTDITARKKTESENAENKQAVWHLNRVAALGELTASLAHEINQPLAAILNSAEAAAALLNRSSPDIAEALEAITDIIHDDKRAGAVIDKMRSMLRRSQESAQAVDLNAIVSGTLRLVTSEARLRHVILHHAATPDLPCVVADPTQLQQVILNLITNGIEATETTPHRRHVEISTSLLAKDGMQLLEVRDSGPGIPVEKLSRIFEPFYTTKRAGLGFGLSICRSIVDSFGGKITVESPPEGGAVFKVFLRTFADVSTKVDQVMQAGS